MRKSLLLFWAFVPFISISQEWTTMMQDPNANFYTVKAAFENYWSTRDITEKGKGYKAFKRWENFVEKRVYPSGDMTLLWQNEANFKQFLKNNTASQSSSGSKGLGNAGMTASTTWTAMGPFGALSGSAGGQLLKSGRINFITIDPNNSSNLWIGAPAGGLWSSTNGGGSWSTNTDFLNVVGCSDLAIDPTNSSIMYLATGDGDGGDTRSIGVLKSTNGGVTWSPTGLSNNVASYFLIHRLIINPSNTQVLLAATTSGLYRSSNGGVNWSQITTGNVYDLEFKPGNSNVVYAAGASFLISTNNGVSFTTVSNGIPTSGVNRMAIAVTPADPAYVYVVASSNTNSGLQGFYRSIVSGTVFSQMTTTLNLLGWATAGNDAGGQGWYDLCIAASPLNRDEVVVGGVNIWRTTDAGGTWGIYGHWTGSGAPFTHADQHDLEYDASGNLYNTNDGTVYKRTSTTWTEISGTINISQIYRIGLSSVSANRWITGHQDNGTSVFNGLTYSASLGGDGMDCFIDRTTNNNVFGEYQNGSLRKSTNGGSTWTTCTSGLTGTAPWVTIWKQDPVSASVLYCGYTNMFVSINQGTSWTALTAITGAGTIREFAIAKSNNQVIYVLKSSGVFKTTNGGTSWSNVTGSLPIAAASPEYIAVDPKDPNSAWVVFSGYSSGNKVFMTINGGSSWTNYSSNLPNLPVNCIVYQPNTQDLLYIGMDVGVYHRDSLSSAWTLYNAGLPNVPISELEISPAAPTILHAATYGRGVWAVSVFAPNVPVSNFSIPVAAKCAGSALTFTDLSTNSASSWSWSVTPTLGVITGSLGVPNPTISFLLGGTYIISMQAANSIGAGNIKTQTVVITPLPVLNITNNPATICKGGVATFTASGASSYSWSHGGGSGASAGFLPAATTVYTVTGTSNGCSSAAQATVNISNFSVSITGASSLCPGASANLLALGGTSYTWTGASPGSVLNISPSATTVYTVTGTSAQGCTAVAQQTVFLYDPPPVILTSTDEIICLDQSATLVSGGAFTYTWMPGGYTGTLNTVTPSVTTVYTVTGTDMNGCDNSAYFMVTVDICEELSNAISLDGNSLSLYPNPVRSKLLIVSLTGKLLDCRVMIMDATGRLVFNDELHFTGRQSEINLQALASGSYYIRVTTPDEKSRVVKIIKE
jgi:hypothetical protein